MKTFDTDIPLEKYNDVGKNWRRINVDELLSDLVNQAPTENDEKLAYHVDEETQYDRTFGNINISGNVPINQCGIILIQKNYHTKGSILHKFYSNDTCLQS